MKKKKHFTKQQLAIIRHNYAQKAAEEKKAGTNRDKFPDKFPFWARLKISKNRTTLVIDEERGLDKKTHKVEDMYVHREATHTKGHGEPVTPNPDKDDPEPMYLRSPRKLPKRMFLPHNKNLDMPEDLRKRYDKNNRGKDE